MKCQKLKWKYCSVKHKKNPEADGERDRSLRSAKLKKNEITITEGRKETETRKDRKQVNISVNSVRKGCQMPMEGRI